MSTIPKTLIIGVFLHGELHLNENGELNNDIVPDGISIHVINSVAPGVPNISTLENYEHMATQISKIIRRNRNYDKLTNYQINSLVENLRVMLVKENKNQSTDIIKQHQHLYSKNKVNPVFQQYTYQYSNSFKIKTYNSKDIIPNKLFTKMSQEDVINPDNIPKKYFNNIVLYNLEELDLFKMLLTAGLDIEKITLGQMLEFLVGLGVQNLIMVDMSCSVFKGNSEFLTERNIRHIRRKMLFN
jgi:hypothetical protein